MEGGERSMEEGRIHYVLNLLDFLADNDGVCLADLLGAKSVVVERTFMLVRVAVKAAKETATSAFESCESDFLSALMASILFRLFAVLVLVRRTVGECAVVQSTCYFCGSAARSRRWADDGNCGRSRLEGGG